MAAEMLKVNLAVHLGIVDDGRDAREVRRNAPVLLGMLESTASAYGEVADRRTSLKVDRHESNHSIALRQPILGRGRIMARIN